MILTRKLDHTVLWSLAFVALLTAVAVALFNPGSLAFRAFDAQRYGVAPAAPVGIADRFAAVQDRERIEDIPFLYLEEFRVIG